MLSSVHRPSVSAWIGLAIVTTFILVALFAPILAPYGEAESVGETWLEPSSQFLLGTDSIGRDMLTRLIYGARMTIGVAFLTTVLSFLIGTMAGLLAATGSSLIDQALSRFVDVMLSIPILVFALIILSVFGSSIFNLDPHHCSVGLHTRFPSGTFGGDEHRGGGVRGGRTAAGRGVVVDHAAGDIAECASANDFRIWLAVLLQFSFRCGPFLPWPRYTAAVRGLGRNGSGKWKGHQLRHFRAAMACIGHCHDDGRREPRR